MDLSNELLKLREVFTQLKKIKKSQRMAVTILCGMYERFEKEYNNTPSQSEDSNYSVLVDEND